MTDVIEPLILIAKGDPEQKPRMYACGKCGALHSPGIYACGIERAHEVALQAARDCYTCRTHNVCDTCGEDAPKGWTRCSSCRFAAKLEKAVEIPDDGGPYFDFGGDTFYHDIESAGEDGIEWLAPCTVTYPKLDADSILENLLDDMYEDASTDDMDGVTEFYAAVKVFNEAQKTRSFWADESRKIRVPAQGMSAGTAKTAQPVDGDSPPARSEGCAHE